MAEALATGDAHVRVWRKNGTGPVLLLIPNQKYLDKIRNAPDAQLEMLARQCGEVPETKLFTVQRVPASEPNSM